MKKLLVTLLLAVAFVPPALAQHKAEDHSAHQSAASTPAAAEMTEGEIRKIDTAAGTMTIRHGEIKNLGMPPMTMVFKAKSDALFAKVKVGDKVRFTAEATPAGALVVTDVLIATQAP